MLIRSTARAGTGAATAVETPLLANNPGTSAAARHMPLVASRTSLAGITRPSLFHSRSVARVTGPYSRPATRTIHSAGPATFSRGFTEGFELQSGSLFKL